ncbi:MAG TPA: J domain-containing protein [Vicinamibacterales bacterium]|nr:J domain-containing protein [Vicinamibacterales bacterium]
MDFYFVLGIDRNASVVEVKRAYRRLARKFHPDINPGDQLAAAQFRRISEAYQTLVDPERRRLYDLMGHKPESEPEPAVGFEGFDFSPSVHANQQSTFGDLFADILRGPRAAARPPERGADLHASITVSFADALHGAQHALTITRQDRCATCNGSGIVHGGGSRCTTCQGTGSIRSARGHMVFSRSCARCGGTGVQRQQRCLLCAGSGTQPRTETVTVHVPAGVPDGLRLRIEGKGHAGVQGGPPGDLYVTVNLAPHPRLRREGDDVLLVLPVAVHEAALGARIDVPALEGTVHVRIPPGSQTGQRLRLRGRGFPSMRDGRRGDLIVEIRVMLPKLLDERSKELLREFGRINAESVRDF